MKHISTVHRHMDIVLCQGCLKNMAVCITRLCDQDKDGMWRTIDLNLCDECNRQVKNGNDVFGFLQ